MFYFSFWGTVSVASGMTLLSSWSMVMLYRGLNTKTSVAPSQVEQQQYAFSILAKIRNSYYTEGNQEAFENI
jgi:hypothetical protein